MRLCPYVLSFLINFGRAQNIRQKTKQMKINQENHLPLFIRRKKGVKCQKENKKNDMLIDRISSRLGY